MTFLDITAIPVPLASKDEYVAYAKRLEPVFKEFGAQTIVDTWAVELPDGKVTDFKKAVALRDDETVVISWITWVDKAARDAAWEKLMSDPRMVSSEMPFDGQRMIFGAFDLLIQS